MMDFENFARLHDQSRLGTQSRFRQRLVDGGNGEKRRDAATKRFGLQT